MCDPATFRRICDEIVSVDPPPKGCRVTFRQVPESELDGDYADCGKHKRHFTVSVLKGLHPHHTELLVLHEYAHVMAWRPYHPLHSNHDAIWGVEHARAHRKYHGEA